MIICYKKKMEERSSIKLLRLQFGKQCLCLTIKCENILLAGKYLKLRKHKKMLKLSTPVINDCLACKLVILTRSRFNSPKRCNGPLTF